MCLGKPLPVCTWLYEAACSGLFEYKSGSGICNNNEFIKKARRQRSGMKSNTYGHRILEWPLIVLFQGRAQFLSGLAKCTKGSVCYASRRHSGLFALSWRVPLTDHTLTGGHRRRGLLLSISPFLVYSGVYGNRSPKTIKKQKQRKQLTCGQSRPLS